LGNEPTIEAFIWHLLLVMREVRRVLRDDGIAWVNLGDSFSGSAQSNGGCSPKSTLTGGGGKYREGSKAELMFDSTQDAQKSLAGVPQGNLLAIPHRFALAAQADGWILRNDCVWHKKSAMPESVSGWKFQDEQLRRGSWRMTRAHEYVFQFVKQMGYWSDSEIVKEPAIHAGDDRKARAQNSHKTMPTELQNGIRPCESGYDLSGRNPRSVFSPSPSPYSGAHFATFPKELIRPLILSSVPRRCCPECGQGWAAVVETRSFGKALSETKYAKNTQAGSMSRSRQAYRAEGLESPPAPLISGYRPTCQCDREDYKPGIVLDPFVGSGTTLEVARECGVKAIGLDISHEYLDEQASWRGLQIAKPKFEDMPLFKGVAG
jgi:DNA modification methylase